MKISYKDRIPNAEVLQKMKEKQLHLCKVIAKKQNKTWLLLVTCFMLFDDPCDDSALSLLEGKTW